MTEHEEHQTQSSTNVKRAKLISAFFGSAVAKEFQTQEAKSLVSALLSMLVAWLSSVGLLGFALLAYTGYRALRPDPDIDQLRLAVGAYAEKVQELSSHIATPEDLRMLANGMRGLAERNSVGTVSWNPTLMVFIPSVSPDWAFSKTYHFSPEHEYFVISAPDPDFLEISNSNGLPLTTGMSLSGSQLSKIGFRQRTRQCGSRSTLAVMEKASNKLLSFEYIIPSTLPIGSCNKTPQ